VSYKKRSVNPLPHTPIPVIIPITLAETVRYFVSEGVHPDTINVCLDDIHSRSTVVPLTEEIAISAGSRKNREVEGFADAIILPTARAGEHQVVTGDPHFREIRDAMFRDQP
jgi:predicted nucleic acid-binding protein